MRQIIMPSDVILHRPTGETWTVCGVDHKAGRLIPCGYPFPTVARIEDCEVIERHYETQYQTEEQIKALQKYELTSFIDVKSAMFHGQMCIRDRMRACIQSIADKEKTLITADRAIQSARQTIAEAEAIIAKGEDIRQAQGAIEALGTRRADAEARLRSFQQAHKAAVSYTHLDVYKRQLQGCRGQHRKRLGLKHERPLADLG